MDVQFTEWGRKLWEERTENLQAQDPTLHCWPTGVPRQAGTPYAMQIVQSKDLVVILCEGAAHAIVLFRPTGERTANGISSGWEIRSGTGRATRWWLWSSGAAGDQNPIYFQQTFDLREIRIKDSAKRGIISNAMPPGGQGLNKKDPEVVRLMDQQKQMIVSMGQFLGEEVLHVMRGMERTDSNVQIYGGVKTVSSPGRTRTNDGRAGFEGTYKDTDPVEIKLNLLRIGDIAIGGMNAEVFNLIGQRLKRESPYARR